MIYDDSTNSNEPYIPYWMGPALGWLPVSIFLIALIAAILALAYSVFHTPLSAISVVPTTTVLDFGLISLSSPVASTALLTPDLNAVLEFDPSQSGSITTYPSTSDSSKFDVTGFHTNRPTTIIYTPVFSSDQVRVNGEASVTMHLTGPSPAVPFYFGVAWSVDLSLPLNVISEILGSCVDDVTISLPFSGIFTPAQLTSTGGSVIFVGYVRAPSPGPVAFSLTGISMLVTEI